MRCPFYLCRSGYAAACKPWAAWCVLSSCETKIVAEHFYPNCWSSRWEEWEAVWCKPWQIRVSLLPLHSPSNDLPSATDQNQNNPIKKNNINLLAKFATDANGATWWLKSIQVVLLCDQQKPTYIPTCPPTYLPIYLPERTPLKILEMCDLTFLWGRGGRMAQS